MVTTDRIDGLTTDVAIKAPVVVATTANITLSGTQTIDGVAVVADDRVLVKDQTDGIENGIYDVSTTAWARSKDFNGARDVVQGTVVFVNSGTVGGPQYFKVDTANDITIGTTSITFSTTFDGDMSGPSSSTDNAVARFTGVGGKTLQNSGAILDDNDLLQAPGGFGATQGADIVSATTIVVGTDGDYFDINGATGPVGTFTVAAGRRFSLQFDSTPTLTHHATNLDLPGETDFIAAAGDILNFFAHTANKVQCTGGVLASGLPFKLTGLRLQGKETIFIPSGSMRATVSNGCATITDVETTSGRPDMQVLDFDATNDEHAQYQIAMPKSWNEGTITFQAYWTTTATDTDGVAWALQGVAVTNDGTIDVAYGTAVVVTDDNISAAEDLLVTAESAAVTISGTPAADDMCFFRVFRDVSDANDDMTEDARLIGIKMFITTDAGDDT